MKKLTPAQQHMMEGAVRHYRLSMQGRDTWWFTPNRLGATVHGTNATAKALCGKGLLKYEVALPAVGKYPEVLHYRITEQGLALMNEE